MKWSVAVALLSLLFAIQSPSARASGPSPYYDQIFADGRLDISIFLSFEQKKPAPIDPGDTPVLKQILTAAAYVVHEVGEVSPIRDRENTASDISDIEQGILGCRDCGIVKDSDEAGYRHYSTRMVYRGKPIEVSIKFIYSDAAVGFEKTKQGFIDALGHDDVIVYLGHSRLGHGFPDFGSPTTDAGLVFVNDPIRGWTNFDKGYFSRDKYQILFLNACLTWNYYQAPLRTKVWEKDPSRLALILSKDTTWFEDYPATTAVFLEGLLSLETRDEMMASLEEAAVFFQQKHADDSKQPHVFTADGLFDDSYVKKPVPKRKAPAEPWHNIPF